MALLKMLTVLHVVVIEKVGNILKVFVRVAHNLLPLLSSIMFPVPWLSSDFKGKALQVGYSHSEGPRFCSAPAGPREYNREVQVIT